MESIVALCKEDATQAMEMFLRNFSHVPDDKLNWTPASTAKSAIRIAAHTALYAGRFARMIQEGKLPGGDDVNKWVARNVAEENAITCRTEVERIFRQGTAEVLAALNSLSPESIASTLDSGQGWSMPMTFLMKLPGWHATLHTGQIDYLQTCWGDDEVYV